VNVLHEWGLRELADDAALIVSELMTNAADASAALPEQPPIALRLLASERSLVIEAWDQSPLALESRKADAGRERVIAAPFHGGRIQDVRCHEAGGVARAQRAAGACAVWTRVGFQPESHVHVEGRAESFDDGLQVAGADEGHRVAGGVSLSTTRDGGRLLRRSHRDSIAVDLDDKDPQEVIGWAIERFQRNHLAICTSFQSDGMAILDMA